MCLGIQLAIKHLIESEDVLVPLLTHERRNKPDLLLQHVEKQLELVRESYVDDLMVFPRDRNLHFVYRGFNLVKHADVKRYGVFCLDVFPYVSQMLRLTVDIEL